jgi:hypothetical protein
VKNASVLFNTGMVGFKYGFCEDCQKPKDFVQAEQQRILLRCDGCQVEDAIVIRRRCDNCGQILIFGGLNPDGNMRMVCPKTTCPTEFILRSYNQEQRSTLTGDYPIRVANF